MKSRRALIMLLLSILTGVAAVLLAARWLGEQAASGNTTVVVATRDLDLGQPLQPSMLQEIAWPTGSEPVGAYREAKKLEGRVVRTSIFKGEPVLEPKLAAVGTKGGLDSIIKEGNRAMTVRVNEVVGVAGFLVPGSYVDLLVNVQENRSGGRSGTISKIVLERILVLAVAQEANRDETKPKVVNAVTLEVTPEQAEKIDLARNIGTLSLVLRNQVDLKDATTAGARQEDLLAQEPTPVASAAKAVVARAAPRPVKRTVRAPVAEPSERVEMIRGIQKANSDF
ncbi:Flp pilus assembly protein CpaB [Ramlibacter sp. 2FC]|uniref:Flp pilus assembly protein CpaB n=1 Tax=Ramlibacter sp. 2FC TaxID=2502188 RepID=UPI0010F8CB6A|nr:Flp pilus assembly protein CpaB [Ramlibacter sp. 2FC]